MNKFSLSPLAWIIMSWVFLFFAGGFLMAGAYLDGPVPIVVAWIVAVISFGWATACICFASDAAR